MAKTTTTRSVRKDARASNSEVQRASATILEMRNEVAKAFFGQEQVVSSLIRALLCDGHVLLEGVPGIAKTLVIKALAQVSGCSSKRIQFTVDLLPTDIIGLTTYTPDKGFEVEKGPIFANFIIADEINRSPPKCVLGETPIFMGNGEIMDIKTILERYSGNQKYQENNEQWIEPKTPLTLLAFDVSDGKIKPEEVKYLYKQKTNVPYHEVKLKSGRSIQTSPVHPFFTISNGKICTINAADIKEGDCILVPRRLSIQGDNTLSYDKALVEKSRIVYEEIKRRRSAYSPALGKEPRYFGYPEDYFFAPSKQFGQVRGIRKPLGVSKELAHFMALLIAEGSVIGSYFYISMKDKEMLEYFIKITRELFDINVNLLYDTKRDIHRIAFRSNSLLALLQAMGHDPHKIAKDKSIPSFILQSSDEIIKEFLKMYYEGDGCISRDCVKVTTKSKNLANSLSYLLLRLGFVARIGHEKLKTHIKGYRYNRAFYNLRLYGGDLHDFYEKIGFYSKGKNDTLHSLIKSIKRNKTDLIPAMQGLIRNARKEYGISHQAFYDTTGMHAHNLENPLNALTISRYRLAKIAQLFNKAHLLHKIVDGDFYCDVVKANNIVQPIKEYWLYDFSMKNTHSFIAGFGGIISHNTQSALIEAMQEKQVTIGKTTFPLPKPFFVMANQNPLENEGVYTLPEAQIDRFLFKIVFSYPSYNDETHIMQSNTTFLRFEDFKIKPVSSPEKISALQKLTHKIYIDEKIKKYIVDIVTRTRTKDFELGKYVELGASPRASIGLYIAAKAEALLQGRNYVIPKDVKTVAYDVLRHRLILSFRSRAEGIDADRIISEILRVVSVP